MQIALEQHLEDLHGEVITPAEELGWYGAALYLVDATNSMLEAVAATDASIPGVVRHRLPTRARGQANLAIYDIEVCTFLTRRAERLGRDFDPRYNLYVYKTLGHDRFVDRFFVPLLLVRDLADCSLHQEACSWRRDGDSWAASVARGYQLQAIGNLSLSSEVAVDDELFAATLAFATNRVAPLAYRASIQGLTEQILNIIVHRSAADSATLHLAPDRESLFSAARTCVVCQPGRGVTVVCPADGGPGAAPRSDGLGAEVLDRELPMRFTGPLLAKRAPRLVEDGVAATDVFPLISAEGRCVGLLYLHYRGVPVTVPYDLAPLITVAAHALDAALRSQRRSLVREHALAEGMRFANNSAESLEDRVWAMANFAWNLLGCDHVCIVLADDAAEPHAPRLVRRAGRYLKPGRSQANMVDPQLDDALRRTLIPDDTVYISGGVAASMFGREGFAAEENIEATAVLPLRAEGEGGKPVGMLIADYRAEAHAFETRERDLLERLASFFAAGIRMARGESAYRTLVLRGAALLQKRHQIFSDSLPPFACDSSASWPPRNMPATSPDIRTENF